MPPTNSPPPKEGFASVVAAMGEEAQRRAEHAQFALYERLLSSTYEKANAYSQMVLGVGYVGLFAAWSFTKDLLTRNEVLWSALLGTVSLFVFVLFEVFKMFVVSRAIVRMAGALSTRPSEFVTILAENEAEDLRVQKSAARVWAWCWAFCFVTGVASGCILIGAFVGHLISGE